jgi:biotin carboxyl carrier protein
MSLSITDQLGTTTKTDLKITDTLFEGLLNNKNVSGNFVKINDYQYHFLYNNFSYNIEVIKLNIEDKILVLKINNQRYTLTIKDKYDELLKNLGLDNLTAKKVSDIKAPMPGMVLNILVKEGDEVKKGDTLLILEAMKMENSLKATADGIIKKVVAVKGTAVEKNQILIQF